MEEINCQECDFKATNDAGLKIHSKKEHTQECNKCDYRMTTKYLLKQHTSKSHK